jgi:hypothetical protein
MRDRDTFVFSLFRVTGTGRQGNLDMHSDMVCHLLIPSFPFRCRKSLIFVCFGKVFKGVSKAFVTVGLWVAMELPWVVFALR